MTVSAGCLNEISQNPRSMKLRVAIACAGLGRVRRGFETFAEDLFRQLQGAGSIDAVLFKGAGKATPTEFPLWNIPRSSPVWSLSLGYLDPYIGEQLTFAVSLLRRMKTEPFDIVHVSDCQVASLVAHFMNDGWHRPRILFSNGGPMAPADYHRFDFIHQVNPVELERAVSYGISPARMNLVPYGVDVRRYNPTVQGTMRDRLGIPEEAFVVLTVGAHGTHKRLGFLIRQMRTLNERAHLLVVGQPSSSEWEALHKLGRQLLGGRVSFLALAHEEMPNVYASVDLYVHSSLYEGFGIVFLEAMAAGLPVVHHDEKSMNWIVGSGGVAVDMTDPTALSKVIHQLLVDSNLVKSISLEARRRAEGNFSWDHLLPRYVDMYSQILGLPSN